jgi:radical SAM-linked protein
MIYRPVREREPREVIDVVESAVRDGGYDSASLTSLSTADYSAISPLIHAVTGKLKQHRATLSVSSLRAYGLAEDVLDDLAENGAQGLTFAPEAGSQRMRDVVNKNVTEEQLLETARRVFSRGWTKMKLYFMIGLPTEEDSDVLGIVQTGARAQQVGKQLGNTGAKVTVSVSTHVPKPHTPFQWCAMDTREQVLRKQELLKQEAHGSRVNLRMHASAGSWLEGVLARGDRSLADAIEHAYHAGARFDSWDEGLRLSLWDAAFEHTSVNTERFLGTLPTSANLAWQHIDVGLEPGFLAREYRKALKNRLSPPCGKAVGRFVHHTNLLDHAADARKLVCYDCGVACDLGQMRSERAEFLIALGAREPRVTPAREPSPAPVLAAKSARKRPPARPDQGTPLRIRLCYEKLGRSAFASHLDLVRLLPRLFRRLSLPLYYSLGYHPKPVMIFGSALSLGVLSLGEYVDLKLVAGAPLDCAALPELLSSSSIDGVRFTSAVELGAQDPKLSRVIDEAVYVAGLPRSALDQLGLHGVGELQARLTQGARGPLVVRRNIDGVGKRIDVANYLLDVRVGQDDETLRRAGLLGDLMSVRMRLSVSPSGTAKPSEALEALLGRADLPVRFVRAELLCTQNGVRATPLQLESLRAALNVAPAEGSTGLALPLSESAAG